MQAVAHEGNSALPLRMSYPRWYKSGMMNIHNTSLRSFALVTLHIFALIYAFMLHLNALGSNHACPIPLSLVPENY